MFILRKISYGGGFLYFNAIYKFWTASQVQATVFNEEEQEQINKAEFNTIFDRYPQLRIPGDSRFIEQVNIL